MNVTGPKAADLTDYRLLLERWAGTVMLHRQHQPADIDGILTLTTPAGPVRYLVEEKQHLRHQDIQVVVDRLAHRLKPLLPELADRLLLLAPHIRPQQAKVLEREQIDYLDLAGNVHLDLPGLRVHVEGKKPTPRPPARPQRPQKAWIKLVMALLVRPGLTAAPYRELATQADVALGTVANVMTDLTARGLLTRGHQQRRLHDRANLVAVWVQAFVEGLRPRLRERHFQVKARTKDELWHRLDGALGKRQIRWALTGADAAERRLHHFHAPDTEIYAPIDAIDRELEKALLAQPTQGGGNLVVIAPPGPLAVPPHTLEGPPLAPNLLAYAELRYRGTDQAAETADLLLPQVLKDADG